MKRKLQLLMGIIPGDMVRDILEVFPQIEDKFRQRKTYDEYYFDDTQVELTIEIINSLNQLGFVVNINWETIVLS
ncbi:MAG: hypothetical protein ACOC33_04240 [bacterium]